MIDTFHPMDALFYGLAIYFGYQFAFRRISEEEMMALARQDQPEEPQT